MAKKKRGRKKRQGRRHRKSSSHTGHAGTRQPPDDLTEDTPVEPPLQSGPSFRPQVALETMVMAPLHTGPTEYIALDQAEEAPVPVVVQQPGPPTNPAIPAVSRRAPRELGSLMRRGFVQGVLIGLLVVTPGVAIVLYCMARWGLGNDQASFVLTLSRTAGFAGLPAGLLAGIIGSAAVRGAAAPRARDPSQAVWTTAMSTAAIGVGACLLAAAVMRYLPHRPLSWLGLMVSGGLAGALGGVVLSTWVTAATSKRSHR